VGARLEKLGRLGIAAGIGPIVCPGYEKTGVVFLGGGELKRARFGSEYRKERLRCFLFWMPRDGGGGTPAGDESDCALSEGILRVGIMLMAMIEFNECLMEE